MKMFISSSMFRGAEPAQTCFRFFLSFFNPLKGRDVNWLHLAIHV